MCESCCLLHTRKAAFVDHSKCSDFSVRELKIRIPLDNPADAFVLPADGEAPSTLRSLRVRIYGCGTCNKVFHTAPRFVKDSHFRAERHRECRARASIVFYSMTLKVPWNDRIKIPITPRRVHDLRPIFRGCVPAFSDEGFQKRLDELFSSRAAIWKKIFHRAIAFPRMPFLLFRYLWDIDAPDELRSVKRLGKETFAYVDADGTIKKFSDRKHFLRSMASHAVELLEIVVKDSFPWRLEDLYLEYDGIYKIAGDLDYYLGRKGENDLSVYDIVAETKKYDAAIATQRSRRDENHVLAADILRPFAQYVDFVDGGMQPV
jgi:hypothetical protein